jgi:hypothetical protein
MLSFAHHKQIINPDWQRLMQAVSNHITVPNPVASTPPSVPAPIKKPELVWASATGDDQYGRYADVDVKGIIQRFRWLKPGKGFRLSLGH